MHLSLAGPTPYLSTIPETLKREKRTETGRKGVSHGIEISNHLSRYVYTHVLSAHRWMPHRIPHPTVLDSSIGKPAQDVKVQLLAPSVQEPDQLTPAQAGVWVVIGSSVTNEDGRCSDLVPPHLTLPTGTYQIVFETKEYFDRTSRKSFYPFVQVSGP